MAKIQDDHGKAECKYVVSSSCTTIDIVIESFRVTVIKLVVMDIILGYNINNSKLIQRLIYFHFEG